MTTLIRSYFYSLTDLIISLLVYLPLNCCNTYKITTEENFGNLAYGDDSFPDYPDFLF